MARKRLTPAQADYLAPPGGLETKAWLTPLAAAPIAHVAAEASASAALAEVTAALSEARSEGRLLSRLPLAQIDAGHLVRDRMGTDEDALQGLMDSIRTHGQRTPIEVTPLGGNHYGLISGWRRITALARLHAETDDPRFGSVLAHLRHPDSAEAAYVAMVEENEIRLGLSYYERARIAAKAVELGVFPTEKAALQRLFANASRARRSKIGSFLAVYSALDGALRFPAALPERLGLMLARALETPEGTDRLRIALTGATPATPEAEQALLTAALTAPAPPRAAPEPPAEPPPAAPVEEIRPGVFLTHGGGWTKPVLTLSGPAVGPEFRERLLHWITHGG